MTNSVTLPDATKNMADQAAASADAAIRSTQRLANQALDGMTDSARDLRDSAAPLVQRAGDQLTAMTHRGAEVVREKTKQLRDSGDHLAESTRGYIREEPVKSVLIAAATGAALMALLTLVSRSRNGN